MNFTGKVKRFFCNVCYFCNNRENLESEVYGHYSNINRYYHYKCLLDVLTNPFDHHHRDVDMALQIDETRNDRMRNIKASKKVEQELNEDRLKKIAKVQDRIKNSQ